MPKENYKLKCIYPYDVSKACADLIAQSFSSNLNKIPISITRFSNIYGPGQINFSAGIRISNYNLLGPERQFLYDDKSRLSVPTIEDTVVFDNGENVISFSNLEPRFSFEWKIGSDIVLSSGYSRAAQYLFQISNTANVAPVDVWVLSNRYLLPPRTHNFSIDITRNKFLNFGIISLGYYYRLSSNLKDYIDFADLIVNEHLETEIIDVQGRAYGCLLYTSPSPRDLSTSRMPSSA